MGGPTGCALRAGRRGDEDSARVEDREERGLPLGLDGSGGRERFAVHGFGQRDGARPSMVVILATQILTVGLPRSRVNDRGQTGVGHA